MDDPTIEVDENPDLNLNDFKELLKQSRVEFAFFLSELNKRSPRGITALPGGNASDYWRLLSGLRMKAGKRLPKMEAEALLSEGSSAIAGASNRGFINDLRNGVSLTDEGTLLVDDTLARWVGELFDLGLDDKREATAPKMAAIGVSQLRFFQKDLSALTKVRVDEEISPGSVIQYWYLLSGIVAEGDDKGRLRRAQADFLIPKGLTEEEKPEPGVTGTGGRFYKAAMDRDLVETVHRWDGSYAQLSEVGARAVKRCIAHFIALVAQELAADQTP
jgi:hypothetical protein